MTDSRVSLALEFKDYDPILRHVILPVSLIGLLFVSRRIS